MMSEMRKSIKVDLGKRPTDDEIKAKLNQHMHHLIERTKGRVKTPLGVIEGEDWFCHTCQEWLALYGVKFETKPRIGKEAVWLGGKQLTEEEKKFKEKWDSLSEEEKTIVKLFLARDDVEKRVKALVNNISKKWKLDRRDVLAEVKEAVDSFLEESKVRPEEGG